MSAEPLKIMIAGGGTGGHVYLGITLARELSRRDPSVSLLFVGTKQGLESRIVPAEGYKLEFIVSAGLKRMGLLRMIRNFLLIPRSLLQARRLVSVYLSDVVVGVGGYSSGPVVLAAWWMGKKTLIIEPNAHPGLTNRWLSHFVDRAALALPDTGNYFGTKGIVTGIPVRREFREIPDRSVESGITVLIYGGSQGSHALNEVVCEALPDLKSIGPSLHLIHQTGERELQRVQHAYRDCGAAGEIHAFLPRIYEEFARADLIISRAGAGTVAELTAAGKPSLLVPFPGAADDHQSKNARTLADLGAARLIPEQEWNQARLVSEIKHFMERPEELRRMGQAARRASKPDSARQIADLIFQLASE